MSSTGPNPSSRRPATDLAALDDAGITPLHRKILLVSGMGFFTDAYDLFVIGVVMKLVDEQWHLSVLARSLVTSTALLSSMLGALIFGRIADLVGRKRIYGLECGVPIVTLWLLPEPKGKSLEELTGDLGRP